MDNGWNKPGEFEIKIDNSEIKWNKVYEVEGDENEVMEIISSFCSISKPLDVAKIVKTNGCRKIDIYNPEKKYVSESTDQSQNTSSSDNSSGATDNNVQTKSPDEAKPAQRSQKPTLQSLSTLEELENLFPPLSEEEYQHLKQDIKVNGECIQPIAVWIKKNIVVDGHNRLKACLEIEEESGKKIEYKVLPLSFKDTDEAILWMLRNQLNRRQLSEFDQYQLRLKLREMTTKKNREKRLMNLKQYQNQNSAVDDGNDREDTQIDLHSSCVLEESQDTTIDDLDIPEPSREKLRKVKIIVEHGDPGIIKSLRAGRSTINAAFTKIQQQKKATETSSTNETRDEEEEDQKKRVFESLKLKIGNELIPLECSVDPHYSIIVLKVSKSTRKMEEMLEQQGFEINSRVLDRRGYISVMFDDEYYQ